LTTNRANYDNNKPITSVASFPGCLPLCFLDCICAYTCPSITYVYAVTSITAKWETAWEPRYSYARHLFRKWGGSCLLCLNAGYAHVWGRENNLIHTISHAQEFWNLCICGCLAILWYHSVCDCKITRKTMGQV